MTEIESRRMIVEFGFESESKEGSTMPVAYQMLFRNGTLDQYDQVLEKMGLSEGHDAPDGALFHWVTATDDGILVVDVWETEAQFEAFSEKQIGPLSREVGLEGPPETSVHQVHNWLGAQASA